MLRCDVKQYEQIGRWLDNLMKKRSLPTKVCRARYTGILVKNGVVSFQYTIVNTNISDHSIKLYIRYNENSKYLNLLMERSSAINNIVYRNNINGNEVEHLIVDMYREIIGNLDINENPFLGHRAI